MEHSLEHYVETYSKNRYRYDALAGDVARILNSFPDAKSKIHRIDPRAKDVDSFRAKCEKTEASGEPKYSNPLKDITDLAGVRVIVFVPSAVKEVCDYVISHFQVNEHRDLGEERFASGHFGYQSIHFLVGMKEERLMLPDFSRHRDLICEIQVRTVLQHAWAEMEHDIRYKSRHDIPKILERKFLALAGLLEIADREFQSVQEEDARLKQAVQVSLEQDLTQTAIAAATATNETNAATDAPQHPSSGIAGAKGASASARNFVAMGKFSEAIELYTEMLRLQPAAHTLYIGRAKARFLAGDQRGALDDLSEANSYNPSDPSIELLRSQIADGHVEVRAVPDDDNSAGDYLKRGNVALSQGLSEEAYVCFVEAQARGYNYAFSKINQCIACAVGRDLSGAQSLLKTMRIIEGSPMEINIRALLLILSIMQGAETRGVVRDELRSSLAKMPEFNFAISPLRYLEKGLGARDGQVDPEISAVFDMLRNPLAEHLAVPASG